MPDTLARSLPLILSTLGPALFLALAAFLARSAALWSWRRYRDSRRMVTPQQLEAIHQLERDRVARRTLARMAGKSDADDAPDLVLHRDVLDRWKADQEELRKLKAELDSLPRLTGMGAHPAW